MMKHSLPMAYALKKKMMQNKMCHGGHMAQGGTVTPQPTSGGFPSIKSTGDFNSSANQVFNKNKIASLCHGGMSHGGMMNEKLTPHRSFAHGGMIHNIMKYPHTKMLEQEPNHHEEMPHLMAEGGLMHGEAGDLYDDESFDAMLDHEGDDSLSDEGENHTGNFHSVRSMGEQAELKNRRSRIVADILGAVKSRQMRG